AARRVVPCDLRLTRDLLAEVGLEVLEGERRCQEDPALGTSAIELRGDDERRARERLRTRERSARATAKQEPSAAHCSQLADAIGIREREQNAARIDVARRRRDPHLSHEL